MWSAGMHSPLSSPIRRCCNVFSYQCNRLGLSTFRPGCKFCACLMERVGRAELVWQFLLLRVNLCHAGATLYLPGFGCIGSYTFRHRSVSEFNKNSVELLTGLAVLISGFQSTEVSIRITIVWMVQVRQKDKGTCLRLPTRYRALRKSCRQCIILPVFQDHKNVTSSAWRLYTIKIHRPVHFVQQCRVKTMLHR